MIRLLCPWYSTFWSFIRNPMPRMILFVLPISCRRRGWIQPMVSLPTFELSFIRAICIILITWSRSRPVACYFTVAAVIYDGAEEKPSNRGTRCEQDAVIFDPKNRLAWWKFAGYWYRTYFTQRIKVTILYVKSSRSPRDLSFCITGVRSIHIISYY